MGLKNKPWILFLLPSSFLFPLSFLSFFLSFFFLPSFLFSAFPFLSFPFPLFLSYPLLLFNLFSSSHNLLPFFRLSPCPISRFSADFPPHRTYIIKVYSMHHKKNAND